MSNVCFSPDGSLFVTASEDSTAKIFELVAGQWQHKSTIRHETWIRNVRFSPDGNHLLTVTHSGTAIIWGLLAGQWRLKVNPLMHSGWVRDASFSPDGSHLFTTSSNSYDNIAKIWLLSNGEVMESDDIS